jgi:hypothetical protein
MRKSMATITSLPPALQEVLGEAGGQALIDVLNQFRAAQRQGIYIPILISIPSALREILGEDGCKALMEVLSQVEAERRNAYERALRQRWGLVEK